MSRISYPRINDSHVITTLGKLLEYTYGTNSTQSVSIVDLTSTCLQNQNKNKELSFFIDQYTIHYN